MENIIKREKFLVSPLVKAVYGFKLTRICKRIAQTHDSMCELQKKYSSSSANLPAEVLKEIIKHFLIAKDFVSKELNCAKSFWHKSQRLEKEIKSLEKRIATLRTRAT